MKFLQCVFFAACATLAVAQSGVAGTDEEFDPTPKYEFQYSIDDPVTGDQKSQQESRDGDKVTGYYTVVESDGSLRKVEYYADAVSGFVATVSHQPGGQAPPAPSTYQTYKPEVKVVSAPVPAPVKVVPAPAPAPVKVVSAPAPQYVSYQQPAATYYQPAPAPAVYYQQPQTTYYQQPAATYYQPAPAPAVVPTSVPAYVSSSGQTAKVTGFFSSPYANYALPGSGNPTGAISRK